MVYGGVLALFLDLVLTGAATTVLPPGSICSPLDLKVQFLRPAWPDGRELGATVDVGHHGHRFATAGARMVDDHGTVVALATSSFEIVADKTWGSLTVADDTPAHEGAGFPSPTQ
jgi:uncharacterized protein (TIGR00369 family)